MFTLGVVSSSETLTTSAGNLQTSSLSAHLVLKETPLQSFKPLSCRLFYSPKTSTPFWATYRKNFRKSLLSAHLRYMQSVMLVDRSVNAVRLSETHTPFDPLMGWVFEIVQNFMLLDPALIRNFQSIFHPLRWWIFKNWHFHPFWRP